MDGLENKVVLITGSASGIGAEMAREFSRHGARLFLVDRNTDGLQKVAQDCVRRGTVECNTISHTANLEVEADVRNVAKTALEKFGRVDVLINNANRIHEKDGYIHDEASLTALDAMYCLNVRTPWILVQELSTTLAEKKGVVINISSAAAKAIMPYSAYGTAKAAMVHMSKIMALEFGRKGVRVNVILPGGVRNTSIFGSMPQDQVNKMLEKYRQTTPLQTLCEPADIAKMAVFLASDAARQITGSEIVVDGGLVLTNKSVDVPQW